MMDYEILNAGTFSASTKLMKDICQFVYLMSLGCRIHNPDQAALNIILRSSIFSDLLAVCGIDNLYAIQMGTSFDSSKPFPKQILPVDDIKWDDKGVVSNRGDPYFIVHQYDRVPELKKLIDERYK
jgi:hypothetical protein